MTVRNAPEISGPHAYCRRPMSGHPDDLLEAYAFGDCADPSVAAHVGACGPCAALVAAAARAAGWLGASHFETPPASLRSRLVAAARSARAPSDSSALDAYAAEVAPLGSLLDGLSPADWRAPVFDGRSVSALVSHLASNDARVSADLGLPPSPPLSSSPLSSSQLSSPSVPSPQVPSPPLLSSPVPFSPAAG